MTPIIGPDNLLAARRGGTAVGVSAQTAAVSVQLSRPEFADSRPCLKAVFQAKSGVADSRSSLLTGTA
jgi:hypothetical protein